MYKRQEGERVGANQLVCTVDESGQIKEILDEQNADNTSLSGSDMRELRTSISGFCANFSPHEFNSVYNFKYELEGTVLKLANINVLEMCIRDRDVINPTENQIAELKSGSVSAFNFMVNLIRNLEITPAQLALDPYSASCVLTDVNTGEVRALVSYPSYDNNRLANGIDAEYYSRISSGEDLSRPMWNYATQMRTAPGSTSVSYTHLDVYKRQCQ